MLDESEVSQAQEWSTQEGIEPDTDGVSCKLGMDSGYEPAHRLGVIGFHTELPSQLGMDHFDPLPCALDRPHHPRPLIPPFVSSPWRNERYLVVLP